MSGPAGPGRLPVRPLYTISELARATRVSRDRMRRLLLDRGIEFLYVGGRPCVPLSEIVAKLKPLWDSVLAAQEVSGEGNTDEDCLD